MVTYQRVGSGVRLRGGGCTIHTHDHSVGCAICHREIPAGEKFSMGPFKIDQPRCRGCEPFDLQATLFEVPA